MEFVHTVDIVISAWREEVKLYSINRRMTDYYYPITLAKCRGEGKLFAALFAMTVRGH